MHITRLSLAIGSSPPARRLLFSQTVQTIFVTVWLPRSWRTTAFATSRLHLAPYLHLSHTVSPSLTHSRSRSSSLEAPPLRSRKRTQRACACCRMCERISPVPSWRAKLSIAYSFVSQCVQDVSQKPCESGLETCNHGVRHRCAHVPYPMRHVFQHCRMAHLAYRSDSYCRARP